MPPRRPTRLGVASVLLAALLGPAAHAQGARIHMHGEGPYAADGMLYTPRGAGAIDGLLVIPGVGGISSAVQSAAQAFVAAGYEVVVLDTNRSGPPGQTAISADETWADASAAADFLAAQANLRPGHLGVLGIGRGAQFALRLAAAGRVRATAIEGVTTDAEHPVVVNTSVLASFAQPGAPTREARATSAGGARVRYYPPREPPSADDAEFFSAADIATVRQSELDFFAQQLRAP